MNKGCVGGCFDVLGHEWRFRLTNACVRLAEAVIWWMCLFQVRSLVIQTPR